MRVDFPKIEELRNSATLTGIEIELARGVQLYSFDKLPARIAQQWANLAEDHYNTGMPPLSLFENTLQSEPCLYIVRVTGGNFASGIIVSYTQKTPANSPEYKGIMMTGMFTPKNFRRRGYGKSLVREFIKNLCIFEELFQVSEGTHLIIEPEEEAKGFWQNAMPMFLSVGFVPKRESLYSFTEMAKVPAQNIVQTSYGYIDQWKVNHNTLLDCMFVGMQVNQAPEYAVMPDHTGWFHPRRTDGTENTGVSVTLSIPRDQLPVFETPVHYAMTGLRIVLTR